jgi:hypothetical protein
MLGRMTGSAAAERKALRNVAIGSALAGAASLAYVGLIDPHRPGSPFPPCMFKLLTGWNCPGCGGLRMTYDVLHGDLAAAVTDNAFALVSLPLLLVWVVVRRRTGRPPFTPAVFWVIGVSVVAWTVVRNLPGFPLVPTMIGS